MAIARLLSTAAETDKVLVVAPGGGKRIEIYGVDINADDTTVASLYADNGTTLLHVRYLISNQRGHPLPPGSQPWDVLPENENLTLTSTGAVNMFTKIIYRLANV
jgi:hypothetical protein